MKDRLPLKRSSCLVFCLEEIMAKYVFVTGGVVSSLGKGITAASLGRLLKARGLKVSIQKFDPYLNFDPGTMSPYQHGEVFVTEDGGETDLDLGHYERFIDENLSINSSVTSGKIYYSVISKERKGEYLGGTIQVIPHITNEIKERIQRVAKHNELDVVITEIGGTVGDIESQPFLEAIRQMKYEVGEENVCYIHVTLVPYLRRAGELKTKPTQHSVKELRSIGIQPDIVVCRTEEELTEDMKDKIALFCNLKPNHVVQNMDAETLYSVPLMLQKEKLDRLVIDRLGLDAKEADLTEWIAMVEREKSLTEECTIALVGKYVELKDAYLSVVEALYHAGLANGIKVNVDWINAEEIESYTDRQIQELFKNTDGILVPGGFGDRGIEGKILAAKYARENNIPYFGICLGMQLAVIEFARHVGGIEDAHSAELSITTNPVINLMPEQEDIEEKGGTMRLGVYPCKVLEGTKAMEAYGSNLIYERHRHRYEFNNIYRQQLENKGLVISGVSPDDRLVEIVEIPTHKWYVACQFHPEFKSRPTKSHPLFHDFIQATMDK